MRSSVPEPSAFFQTLTFPLLLLKKILPISQWGRVFQTRAKDGISLNKATCFMLAPKLDWLVASVLSPETTLSNCSQRHHSLPMSSSLLITSPSTGHLYSLV